MHVTRICQPLYLSPVQKTLRKVAVIIITEHTAT